MRFQAELEMYEGANATWMVAYMPFDARTEFGTGGIIRVQGTVNGFPFHSSIFPSKRGTHFLMVNKKMREGAQVSEPGEILEMTLELERAPKTVKLPSALRKAIDANKAAKKFFDSLPPSSQRYRADMVNDMKSPAAKQEKIAAIVKHMADTGNAVEKTPDFVRMALAKNQASLLRWQKMVRGRKAYYMIYVMDAKTQATRERRAQKLAAMLLKKAL